MTAGNGPGGEHLGNVPMNTKTSFLVRITYATAVALAVFSGGVSTYGLTRFAPGAEVVIAAMGLLFEAGKLTAFAMLHRSMPTLLKTGLLLVGVVLMSLNIVGVAGFLSSAYEHEQTALHAASHAAEAEVGANVATLDRQLKGAEHGISKAREALAKAKGDRDQIKAVNAMIAAATAERDRLVHELAVAQGKKAKTEGAAIQASGEFAAIAFIADATGAGQDAIAHLVILLIASLPDILAVLLLVAAGFTHAQAETAPDAAAPAERTTVKKPTLRQKSAKKGWETRRRNMARKSGPQLAFKN
jgi:hypothetical protein